MWECGKSVRIRSFSGPYFPTFRLNTERYGEVATRDILQKMEKVFLKIPQNSQGNTCVGVPFLLKQQASGPQICKIFQNIFFYITPADECFSAHNFTIVLEISKTAPVLNYLQFITAVQTLRQKCPNAELFVVRICTLFTQ